MRYTTRSGSGATRATCIPFVVDHAPMARYAPTGVEGRATRRGHWSLRNPHITNPNRNLQTPDFLHRKKDSMEAGQPELGHTSQKRGIPPGKLHKWLATGSPVFLTLGLFFRPLSYFSDPWVRKIRTGKTDSEATPGAAVWQRNPLQPPRKRRQR